MILVIDNYDSFVYNLVQAFGSMGEKIAVRRNDKITLQEAMNLSPNRLVISPGPGRPEDAGISNILIKHFYGEIPILGVCLGHQCIANVFGGKIERAERIMHGKTSEIYHDSRTIYHGLSNPFVATRYHSLLVEEDGLPDLIEISSHTSYGEVMGIRVKGTKTEGVQFHPESILTEEGMKLLKNFLEL